jgi:hypothetical protein
MWKKRYFQSPQGKELAHKCFVEAEVVFNRIFDARGLRA